MNCKISFLLVIFLLLAVVPAMSHEKVVVVPLGGKGYEPQNPVVITGAEFRSDGSSPGSSSVDFLSGRISGNSVSGGCVVARAYIPDGVTITKITGLVYDNDIDRSVVIRFRRASISFPRGDDISMAQIQTSTESTSDQEITSSSINDSLIDAENYTYFLTSCLPSYSTAIYAVKIYYQK